MSVINQMLQDLDRRQGGTVADEAGSAHVRPVKPSPEKRHAFWATIGLLIGLALGWVGWVGYQLSPRPLATELAFRTMDEARSHQVPAAGPGPLAQPPSPAPAAAAPIAPAPPVAAPAQPATAPEAPTSAPQVEMLRLAESIATPIIESKPVARAPAPPAKAQPKAPPPAPSKPIAAAKPAAPASTAAAKSPAKPRFERQERLGSAAERAENEFRHAVSVLKLGRNSEAEAHFLRALELDAAHRGARQALIAMHIERGQLELARKLLQEGLAIDPGQPEFAIALARIYVERKDLSSALAVLDRSAGAAGEVPEFHVLRGTLLQRLGRHAEAADAYQTALQARSTLPQAWVGLGISLEALNRRPEAADAFKRALAAGPLSAEVRSFAEQRARALR